MDLRTLTRSVQEQLAASAAVGDDSTQRAAQLLSISLEPALRLALQDAITQVAAEVSADLAPGRVDLALIGGELEVRVVPPAPASAQVPPPAPEAPPAPPAPAAEGDPDSPASRVTFRPPQQLKSRLERAAADEALSLNTYLVRALTAHLDGASRADVSGAPFTRSGRTSGWFI